MKFKKIVWRRTQYSQYFGFVNEMCIFCIGSNLTFNPKKIIQMDCFLPVLGYGRYFPTTDEAKEHAEIIWQGFCNDITEEG